MEEYEGVFEKERPFVGGTVSWVSSRDMPGFMYGLLSCSDSEVANVALREL